MAAIERSMTVRNGAHALVEALVNEGVSTLFGIPGVGTLPVYDALLDHPELRHIETRHEQGAVFMADGYARATGDVGVAFTSGGPGSFNTVTAMATAFNDSSPVLHLMNENPPNVRRKGRGHFHDMSDQLGVFRSVSDFAVQATLADEIPNAIHQAMFALRNRRPRPAVVEIAAEAFDACTRASIPDRAEADPIAPDPDDVAEAARMVAHAQRPLIWAGGGVSTIEAANALRRLAESIGAPVITTQKGKGALSAEHPLHIGNWANERPVRELIASSDVVIAVGTRFSYFPTGGWSLRFDAPIIQIDMDATEIGRNYPVRIGMVADAELALGHLARAIEDIGTIGRVGPADHVASALDSIQRVIGRPVEVRVIEALRSALPDESLVFNDPTTIAFWARSLWRATRPRTWFVPSGFGTLGSALPTAIGAKVARPNTPTVAVLGDAGVMFTIQDLMTAVQEQVGVIVLIFNDRGYGVERHHQDHLYGRRNAVDLTPPDFVAVAEAFGARGMFVDEPTDIGRAIASVLDTKEPVLIEIPNRFSHPGYGSLGRWDS